MVEWCLGVSAWQHILSFALHNSCMFELRCRTGHVYSLHWCIQGLKKTLKKAIHLYSCIHNTTMTLSVAPKGNNTSYVTSTQWSIYSTRQTCCCWPPLPLSLWSFGLGDWHCATDRHRHPVLVVHCDKRVTWYFAVVHIASFLAPAEKNPAAHFSFVHFQYGNFQVSVFVFKFPDRAYHLQT